MKPSLVFAVVYRRTPDVPDFALDSLHLEKETAQSRITELDPFKFPDIQIVEMKRGSQIPNTFIGKVLNQLWEWI